MKALKVLSIDFDYFQKADKGVLTECYPDGVDLGTAVSNMVWSSHYANPHLEKRIRSVKADTQGLSDAITIICNQRNDIPVMVVNSHKHIYQFILDNLNGYDGVDLTNVDMHPDYKNNNPALDCGNWISHLEKAVPKLKLTWIANRVSKEVFGLSGLPVDYDFSKIKNKKFDLVFVCRSDNWFPPHLDDAWVDFLSVIKSQFNSMMVNNEILKPRDIWDYVEETKKVIRELNSAV